MALPSKGRDCKRCFHSKITSTPLSFTNTPSSRCSCIPACPITSIINNINFTKGPFTIRLIDTSPTLPTPPPPPPPQAPPPPVSRPPSPEPVAYVDKDVTMEPIPQPPSLAPHHQTRDGSPLYPAFGVGEYLLNTSEEEIRELLGWDASGLDYDDFCRMHPYVRVDHVISMRERAELRGMKRLRS